MRAMAGDTGHHIRPPIDRRKVDIRKADALPGNGNQGVVNVKRSKFPGIRDCNVDRMSNPGRVGNGFIMEITVAPDTLLIDRATLEITGIGTGFPLVDIVLGG